MSGPHRTPAARTSPPSEKAQPRERSKPVMIPAPALEMFPEKVPANLHWVLTASVFVHSLTALITIAAFIIHVYMSIWMTPGSMKAMMEGHVSERWARAHHRLWYEKITGRRNAP